MVKIIYITVSLFFLNIAVLLGQNCDSSISNVVVSNIGDPTISFELSNKQNFEINLYDNSTKKYILNTSKIVPDSNDNLNITLVENDNSITIKGLSNELIKHSLVLVLVSKVEGCKPLKIELN
ncbi:hypothetical protein [Marivirga sp.]|uniref:hypothetical protein n=1 Tax=Marivirga sp. TaxID=2018662 RepID=UPI002D7F1248|nr:hypothetical protein [Marivirga sp.]HET8858326.1 hypothetical protein [Marivirga sp.]